MVKLYKVYVREMEEFMLNLLLLEEDSEWHHMSCDSRYFELYMRTAELCAETIERVIYYDLIKARHKIYTKASAAETDAVAQRIDQYRQDRGPAEQYGSAVEYSSDRQARLDLGEDPDPFVC